MNISFSITEINYIHICNKLGQYLSNEDKASILTFPKTKVHSAKNAIVVHMVGYLELQYDHIHQYFVSNNPLLVLNFRNFP